MDEAELGGVQCLAMKIQPFQQLPMDRLGPAINRVPEQRMADRGHMDAHLVGSSRFEPAFDQGGIRQRLDDSIARHRPLAARLLTTAIFLRFAEERASGASIVPPAGSGGPRRSPSSAARCCAGELAGQPLMRDVGLGDDQQPGRVLVDPVDDARPRHPADADSRPAQ